jgi:hypothetical protein
VVEIFNNLVRRLFQIAEIYQKPDIIKLRAFGINLDLIIMPVQVFAFPFLTAQLMRRREIAFNHYFIKRCHT